MKLSDIHIRDPYIFAEDGVYYMYGTRIGVNGVPKPCTGLDVYTSSDLEQWSEPFECFTRPDDFWANWDFFAPEVHKFNGKYYMFASFRSATRRRASHILVADSPKGPFVPLTKEAFTPEDWNCLDATFYVDENGKPWSVYCHEWTQVKDGTMEAVQLSDDLKEVITEPVTLFKAGEVDWKFTLQGGEDNSTDGNYVTDGPFLYKHSSGKLLMLWSSFSDHCFYVQAVAVSESGNILGPWHHDHKLLYTNDGGHGMIFKKFNGELCLVLHHTNVRPNERATLVPIRETESGLEPI